jgi:hypothetical protein
MKPNPKPNPYKNLRSQALSMSPDQLGIQKMPVWGLLMETGYPEAVATLVALGDGAVSLYFSNGGGIIGIGQHDVPRRIAAELLQMAPSFLEKTSAASKYPLPGEGETTFYFLTPEGVRAFHAKEEELGNDRTPLSPLFFKCHELIGAAREASGG